MINPPTDADLTKILEEYYRYTKVFRKQALQWLLQHTVWNHAIELLPGALTTLLGQLLPLTQEKVMKAYKFTTEHLK
jgi:hypothetical protein